MSQAERIKQASQIKIGGSEDEAKEAVKKLFKKSTSQKHTTATSKELDVRYEADLNRLAYLLDCDFEGTLKDDEEIELSLLEKEFKGLVVPALSNLIYQSPTFKTKKELNYYNNLVSDLKMFETSATESDNIKKRNEKFIKMLRDELNNLRENFYKKFYIPLDCEDLF